VYAYRGLIVLSGFSFLVYGLLCVFSQAMVAEFTRFGLARYRVLTGILEILGGAGLLVGLFWPRVLVLSSFGLALLMGLGLLTRLRIGDGFLASSQALFFLLVNLIIFINAWRNIS
jgi:hypothetical protein